jgi:DNA-binding LytR/AlgR family response regulator
MHRTVTTDDTTGLLVLAVDDEKAGLDELAYQLRENARVARVLVASHAAEALRLVRDDGDDEVRERKRANRPPVDAAFVDINMPGLSGMDLAYVFADYEYPPSLVFATGIPDEAVAAFDMGAVDYLLKPWTADRLDRAIDRVVADQARRAAAAPHVSPNAPAAPEVEADEVIPVELAGTTKLISRSAVRWVEAQGDYARLHTAAESHLVRIPLAQLEEHWAEAGFVRIHRSYLVSLRAITELSMGASGYTVVLGNDEERLPVSRRHTRALKDRLVRPPRGGWESSE